ncbi:MAG: DUF2997 domain-containing protein [Gloeomargarita sp. SKYBB_i_bin120]|nr:DUF2997 domain-containing protein [Gloeomargarita sp. SKYG98]MCS7293503.1 DUF2997 domain-containing protein [Gloeomargarita sp. SKYB120]MDW8179069.1 DUF2997 domain-containing protein [Gloeomargarita sp. SKYBB_i_bin120]
METLEFVIHPDGRVELRVQGVPGATCVALSQAIEQELGVVTHREWTAEYFQAVVAQPQQQDVHVR